MPELSLLGAITNTEQKDGPCPSDLNLSSFMLKSASYFLSMNYLLCPPKNLALP